MGFFPRGSSAAPEFGTTSRIINAVVLLQVLTIIVSRGDVNLRGEAYAFGVVWSFSMNALSVLLLRFKMPGHREWKVLLNIHIRGVEIPIGLGLITLFLFTLACINLLTKQVATISGILFTSVFFVTFAVSERVNRRRHAEASGTRGEQFQLEQREDLSQDNLSVRRHVHGCGCQDPEENSRFS